MREFVYIAMYNSDTTEGIGPMVIDKVFTNRPEAENYIDYRPGVQDRRAKWSEQRHGDWRIEQCRLFQYASLAERYDEKKEITAALSKLTDRERKLLGV